VKLPLSIARVNGRVSTIDAEAIRSLCDQFSDRPITKERNFNQNMEDIISHLEVNHIYLSILLNLLIFIIIIYSGVE
jgi:hypothetical protein